jgi:hypothetical protein
MTSRYPGRMRPSHEWLVMPHIFSGASGIYGVLFVANPNRTLLIARSELVSKGGMSFTQVDTTCCALGKRRFMGYVRRGSSEFSAKLTD